MRFIAFLSVSACCLLQPVQALADPLPVGSVCSPAAPGTPGGVATQEAANAACAQHKCMPGPQKNKDENSAWYCGDPRYNCVVPFHKEGAMKNMGGCRGAAPNDVIYACGQTDGKGPNRFIPIEDGKSRCPPLPRVCKSGEYDARGRPLDGIDCVMKIPTERPHMWNLGQ